MHLVWLWVTCSRVIQFIVECHEKIYSTFISRQEQQWSHRPFQCGIRGRWPCVRPSPVVFLYSAPSSKQSSCLSLSPAGECTSPACMSTVSGWSTSPRNSTCSRSLRKSTSVWRPSSSLASVSIEAVVLPLTDSSAFTGCIGRLSLSITLYSSSRGSQKSEVFWRATDDVH